MERLSVEQIRCYLESSDEFSDNTDDDPDWVDYVIIIMVLSGRLDDIYLNQ
jgi:hypothetical protein